MGSIPCALVFIQHDLSVGIHVTATVYPHVAFASCRAAIPVYQTWCFIRLYHMVIVQKFMEIIPHHGDILLTKTDHPVRHVLPCDCQTIPFEFLLQPVQGNCIDILCVHDSCCKGCRYRTAMKKTLRMFCLDDGSILFTGIHADMMFIHFNLGRDEMVLSGYGIRQLFPTVFTEFFRQFFFRHVVRNDIDIKTGHVLFLFSLGLGLLFI